MSGIADGLAATAVVVLVIILLPKIWRADRSFNDNIVNVGFAVVAVIFIALFILKFLVSHWFITSLIIGGIVFAVTKKPESGLVAAILSGVILFAGSFFLDDNKKNPQENFQQQVQRPTAKDKKSKKQEKKDDDETENSDESSTNTDSRDKQLFFTGKDHQVGEDGDKYYLDRYFFENNRFVCEVTKINGNTSEKRTYTFYDFYTEHGPAFYATLDSAGRETDRGNISMTVSPVVHALWSKTVEPKVKNYVGENNTSKKPVEEYYSGKFNGTGASGYLLTRTLRKINESTYSVTLKAVFHDGKTQNQNIDYTFYEVNDASKVSFKNSDGFHGKIDPNKTPVEYNMWQYILTNR